MIIIKEGKISLIAIFANIFLFIIKLIAGVLSNSIAVITDAFNSLLDIFSYLFVHISIKVSKKAADKEHPFGHKRAQPIAGFLIAIFAGIVGFELFRKAILDFFYPEELIITKFTICVLIICIITKLLMFYFLRKIGRKTKSTALLACAIDSKNDVLATSAALVGVIGGAYNISYLDNIAAIIIVGIIIKGGYAIGMENMNYLMGRSPTRTVIEQIKHDVSRVKGVLAVKSVKAHYVGTDIHAEIIVLVDKNFKTAKIHNLSETVRKKVEVIEGIGRAFIHIEPMKKKK